MVVYWEYAFAENFALDALLLLLALVVLRARVKVWRLLLASAVGAGQAIVFPLLPLPLWASYVVKFLFGVMLCLIVAPKGFKAFALTTAAFFALTFVYGGMLTAVYSFMGIDYAEGNGYLVEQAPVALVLCGGIALCVAVILGARAFYRYRKIKRNLTECALQIGERKVLWQGFCDSGNLLVFRERPVCVVSAAGIFALFGARPPSAGRITLTTVNGSREAPVFLCDCITVGGCEYKEVYLTVGEVPVKQYQIILHNTMSGEQHETFQPIAGLAKKSGGR